MNAEVDICACGKKIYYTYQHALNDTRRMLRKRQGKRAALEHTIELHPYRCRINSNLHLGNWNQRNFKAEPPPPAGKPMTAEQNEFQSKLRQAIFDAMANKKTSLSPEERML